MANSDLLKFIASKKSKTIGSALEYYDVIIEMLKSSDYVYADDFLVSVLKQIEETESITDGQIWAIENIRAKTNRYNPWKR